MRKLIFSPPSYLNDKHDYLDDISRICKIAASKGYYLEHLDAKLAREEYSDSLCASWLILSQNDEDTWQCVSRYLKEIDV